MKNKIFKRFKTFREMEDFIEAHRDYKIVHIETLVNQDKRHLLVMERRDKDEIYRK